MNSLYYQYNIQYYKSDPIRLRTHSRYLFTSLTGPMTINAGEFVEERNLYWSVRSVIAEFTETPFGFPIQKLILGKEAFDWFDSEKNGDFIAYILTRKLTDYLQGTRAHIELVDGRFYYNVFRYVP